jgi:hypothetical protein
LLSLKRWELRTYEPTGLRMKLKRLRRSEAKPLDLAIVKVFGEMDRGREVSKTERAEINLEALEQISDEQRREWFDSWVKDVEGLEIDGEPVTTGLGLLEEADDTLILWVLLEISGLSKLSAAEGKDSRLLSPSQSEQAPPSSDSPVPPIEPSDGTGPSDATATTEAESSFSPVEA